MLELVNDDIRVFIGYDKVESVAYHTLAHSILSKSSNPVSISPVISHQLRPPFNRERNALQSNDFSFTRFLVPWMCGYEGWAIFMDCDMMLRDDISKLWNLRSNRYAVQVVKHDYIPRDEVKYLGNKQTPYPKKNWSSVMLFNCRKCKALTPDYVNTASGLELHQFKWVGESEVGGLPAEWNHLVGEYDFDPNAKNVHFTVGGPYFDEYANCDYSDEWFDMKREMNHCEQLAVPRMRVSEK